MTASESTPAEKESTDHEPHLFEREDPLGVMAGEVFCEPETAAVTIDRHGDELVSVHFREATNSRGLSVTLLLPLGEARELIDELAAAVEEIEDAQRD